MPNSQGLTRRYEVGILAIERQNYLHNTIKMLIKNQENNLTNKIKERTMDSVIGTLFMPARAESIMLFGYIQSCISKSIVNNQVNIL